MQSVQENNSLVLPPKLHTLSPSARYVTNIDKRLVAIARETFPLDANRKKNWAFWDDIIREGLLAKAAKEASVEVSKSA